MSAAGDTRKPFNTRELATRLGRSQDWIYAHWTELKAAGLPDTILPFGYHTWDRAKMEAWLKGCGVPSAPANDVAPNVPQSDEQHRAYLAQVYPGR